MSTNNLEPESNLSPEDNRVTGLENISNELTQSEESPDNNLEANKTDANQTQTQTEQQADAAAMRESASMKAESLKQDASKMLELLVQQEEEKLEAMLNDLKKQQEAMQDKISATSEEQSAVQENGIVLENLLLKEKLEDPLKALDRIQDSHQKSIDLLMGEIDSNLEASQASQSSTMDGGKAEEVNDKKDNCKEMNKVKSESANQEQNTGSQA